MSSTTNHDDPVWLEEQYHTEGLSLREIADKAGVSDTTIYRRMKKFGIERRSTHPAEALSPRLDSDGHRAFENKLDGERYWVTVHRLHATLLVDDIAELPGKDIHHINGCPFDNRLENYEIVSKSDHQRKHSFSVLPDYKVLCTDCDSASYFFDTEDISYCPTCAKELLNKEVVTARAIDWEINH